MGLSRTQSRTTSADQPRRRAAAGSDISRSRAQFHPATGAIPRSAVATGICPLSPRSLRSLRNLYSPPLYLEPYRIRISSRAGSQLRRTLGTYLHGSMTGGAPDMPRAQRSAPLHRQIYDHIASAIAAGEPGYAPGDKLPSIREAARDWDVAFQAAQQAYGLLVSARLAETRGRSGTFVAEPRNVLGPQQRLRRASAGEIVTVRAAELIPVPAYVRPILGL